MTKLARLNSRKPPAIIYFFRVAWAASYSEFLLWMVGRRVWCNIGRFSASWVKLDRERRPGGSSLSNGCCDRPSVGRCIGGRLPTISSSESWEYRPGLGGLSRDSGSSMLSEATMALVQCASALGLGMGMEEVFAVARDRTMAWLNVLAAQDNR
jgi:hypothetical protein